MRTASALVVRVVHPELNHAASPKAEGRTSRTLITEAGTQEGITPAPYQVVVLRAERLRALAV